MSEGMARAFQQLRLNEAACLGLREAIRPLVDSRVPLGKVVDFCQRLYCAHYSLESDPDCEVADFPIDIDEIMIINNYVSSEDGEWAKDVLHQTRQVLYELTTGHEAVRLASSKDAKLLFEGVTLDPDEAIKPPAPEEPEEDKSERPGEEKVV